MTRSKGALTATLLGALLAAGYTLMRQEHVKIDVISGRFSKRTQIVIDIVGLCFFLMPFVIVVPSCASHAPGVVGVGT